MEPQPQRPRQDYGAFVLGAIILAVGIYYLLQQTLGLDIPDLEWDRIWPVALILLGAAIVFGAWSRRGAA